MALPKEKKAEKLILPKRRHETESSISGGPFKVRAKEGTRQRGGEAQK